MFVSQLENFGDYVLFEPNYVIIYQNFKVTSTPIMECKRLESNYVILAETTYVEKRQTDETSDLWHARVEHVS